MSHSPASSRPQRATAPTPIDGPATPIEILHGPIEAALAEACEFADGCPVRLGEAIRYALLAPGKRLRPILVLMAAEACSNHKLAASGARAESNESTDFTETPLWMSLAMPGAVAVEMIHAYSLIHDDLPAMDDDDLRRGRPTVHIEFDEATAILAGDALQAEAFRHLTGKVASAQAGFKAIAVLSEAAGAAKLVGGQVDDLLAETDPKWHQTRTESVGKGKVESCGENVSYSETAAGNETAAGKSETAAANNDLLAHLQSIHARKTGALFSASLDLGAVLIDADDDARSALGRYAKDLGLAFQVVDDYLDFTADTATLGKRSGKDADRGKLTYPGLLGIEATKQKATDLVESAKESVGLFGDYAHRFLWLADYVLERTH